MNTDVLESFALKNAYQSSENGNFAEAMDWLKRIPSNKRPKELECHVAYSYAKTLLGKKNWGKAVDYLEVACSKTNDYLLQKRLSLARQRKPLMADNIWETMNSVTDRPVRLNINQLKPEVESVWACSAYYSRGSKQSSPWSKLLRIDKKMHEIEEEDIEAAHGLSSAFLCRFIHDMTNILSYADAVVAIPPNPYRYINRGWSFPDILAKGIQKYLALPYEQFALKLIDTNLELRGLNSFERRTRILGAICADNIGLAKGREVILVDDVITSGATMQEAARHLKGAGVKKVHAIALCHTEG
jgi:hypothetical protein